MHVVIISVSAYTGKGRGEIAPGRFGCGGGKHCTAVHQKTSMDGSIDNSDRIHAEDHFTADLDTVVGGNRPDGDIETI